VEAARRFSPQKHVPSLATDAITVENLAQLTQPPGSFSVDDLHSLELENELLSLRERVRARASP
jgi:hypothetical protein